MKIKLYKLLTEDITIPLKKNDVFLYGKFKNKKAVFDYTIENEKGEIQVVTDTGKIIPLLKIRLIKDKL